MTDVWVDGVVERISPEAPVPVFKETSRRECLGGMANMAANMAEMRVGTVIGLMRSDIPSDPPYKPITKTRYHSNGHQILRVDAEDTTPISGEVERGLIEHIREHGQRVDLIAVSDYGKGFVTREVMRAAVNTGKPVVVDPTGHDFTLYRGVTVIKPNRRELFELRHRMGGEVGDAMLSLHAALGAGIVATLGSEGIVGLEARSPLTPFHIPAHKVQVFDLAGAGDTAMAALCASLALGMTLVEAATIANAAAGIAVTKRGTAIVSAEELAGALEGL